MKIIPTIIHSWYKANIILCLLVTSFLGSCDTFVEVDLPESQLTNKSVFDDYQTADAAIVDIYSKMRDTGLLTGSSSGLSYQLGNYSDELTWFGSSVSATQNFYSNALLPSNTVVSGYWRTAYNQIYAANAVLEGSKASLSLASDDKKKLEGEALFIRALLHFYLVNLFGEIPYISTTDYKSNSTSKKIPITKVYELIELDLKAAADLLSLVEQNNSRIRPGRSAVHSLLARVYLYNGSWLDASNISSSVLNKTGYYTLEGIDTVFLKDSKETIWQLQPSAAGKNTDEAPLFIFSSGPPSSVSLSNSLINSFDSNDLRKSRWIGTVSNSNSIWYYAFKYKKNNTTPTSVEYSIVFRLAEQYLIRAEARAQQGDLIGAGEDINKVRKRAGLLGTTASTKDELLSAIQKERRCELFTEYGHRFFDLKRTGNIQAALSVKPGWNNTDIFFPLPQTELDLNPELLPQNDGY